MGPWNVMSTNRFVDFERKKSQASQNLIWIREHSSRVVQGIHKIVVVDTFIYIDNFNLKT